MSSIYNELWYNAHEECDLWHNVLETKNGYQELDDSPNILEDTSPNFETPSEHIRPDF